MTGTTSPYFIEGLFLQTPRFDGMIDLKNMFVSCDIFEDMDKPYITADLILNDDKGWYESADIIGGEKITLRFQSNRDKFDNSTVQVIKKTFYVHYVSTQHRVSEHQQIIMLHLIEEVGYIANLQNVNKFYSGAGQEIIKKIAQDFLFLDNPSFSQKATKLFIDIGLILGLQIRSSENLLMDFYAGLSQRHITWDRLSLIQSIDPNTGDLVTIVDITQNQYPTLGVLLGFKLGYLF